MELLGCRYRICSNNREDRYRVSGYMGSKYWVRYPFNMSGSFADPAIYNGNLNDQRIYFLIK